MASAIDPRPRNTAPAPTRPASRTRRGTGYYKVPSLKGLWYRDTLEQVFLDVARGRAGAQGAVP